MPQKTYKKCYQGSIFGFQAVNIGVKIGQIGYQGLEYQIGRQIAETIPNFSSTESF